MSYSVEAIKPTSDESWQKVNYPGLKAGVSVGADADRR